jgi:hypothetical protein
MLLTVGDIEFPLAMPSSCLNNLPTDYRLTDFQQLYEVVRILNEGFRFSSKTWIL